MMRVIKIEICQPETILYLTSRVVFISIPDVRIATISSIWPAETALSNFCRDKIKINDIEFVLKLLEPGDQPYLLVFLILSLIIETVAIYKHLNDAL